MEVNDKVILYVDDDADDREFLCDAIAKQDPAVKVVVAENGLEALDFLSGLKASQSQLPNLIVLDMNMPFLDGRETFERLKKDETYQTVPIIVFTSSAKPGDKALFNSLGIEFFTKPCDLSYFNSIISHMIDVCH
ncbi:MAG: response regulator [Flavobacterium sp.]|nr:MAG: response regulator [Flavobacterium sp.]